MQLERSDARADRIRFCVRAGRLDTPETYKAVLLLESYAIRGVDFHPLGRNRFYGKQTVPRVGTRTTGIRICRNKTSIFNVE